MRVIFITDVHIKHNNVQEVQILQDTVNKHGKDADYIVLGGDLLHYHGIVHTQLMLRAIEFIKTCADICPTYVLVGNHDYINNSQYCNENHWLVPCKNMANVTIVDTRIFFGPGFVAVPFVPPGELHRALGPVDMSGIRCVFAHQEMKGCKLGSITSVDGDEWPVTWPVICCGHVHEPHTIQGNIVYPGSTLCHQYGQESFGIYEMTFVRCIISRYIPLNIKKKKVHRTTAANMVTKCIKKDTRYIISGTKAEILRLKQQHTEPNITWKVVHDMSTHKIDEKQIHNNIKQCLNVAALQIYERALV